MGIDTLLAEVGKGVGIANRHLVANSQTASGTLAVKSAEVKLQFELTSSSTSAESGLSILKPGAKTISFGTQSLQENSANRCAITLQIVSVMAEPPKEETPATPSPPTLDASALATAIVQLGKRITRSALPAKIKQSLSKELAEISSLLKKEKVSEAYVGLLAFLDTHKHQL